MDKNLIDHGRARIAVNTVGFSLIFGLYLIIILGLGSSRGVATGGTFWVPLIIFFIVCAVGLFIMGRCLGNIVWGVAQVVRGVNASSTAVSAQENNRPQTT